MARRKKASRRRSPRAVSLLNVAESYAYANVLTSGLMGTTPVGFQAFGIVQNNFMNNYQAMAVQSIGIGLSFRLGKRLLRRPISNVNRNIFKPLGAGFKL